MNTVQPSQTDTGGKVASDETSLVDLISILITYKNLILLLTIGVATASVIFSIISLKFSTNKSFFPNVYTASADLLINNLTFSEQINSTTQSILNNYDLGISGATSYSNLALYLIQSNPFLDTIIKKFDLTERYKIKDYQKSNSRRALKKKLTADFDTDSGILTLNYTDTDPEVSKEIVNYAVTYLQDLFTKIRLDEKSLEKKNLELSLATTSENIDKLQTEIHNLELSGADTGKYEKAPSIVINFSMLNLELRTQRSIYESLTLELESVKSKMANNLPVFQIIEKAECPEYKSGPSRGKLCIIATFAAFFVSVFIAFIANAIKNVRNNPEAIAKLSGKT